MKKVLFLLLVAFLLLGSGSATEGLHSVLAQGSCRPLSPELERWTSDSGRASNAPYCYHLTDVRYYYPDEDVSLGLIVSAESGRFHVYMRQNLAQQPSTVVQNSNRKDYGEGVTASNPLLLFEDEPANDYTLIVNPVDGGSFRVEAAVLTNSTERDHQASTHPRLMRSAYSASESPRLEIGPGAYMVLPIDAYCPGNLSIRIDWDSQSELLVAMANEAGSSSFSRFRSYADIDYRILPNLTNWQIVLQNPGSQSVELHNVEYSYPAGCVTYEIVALQSVLSGRFIRAGWTDQTLLAATSNDVRGWETFRLIDLGNDRVALQSAQNNMYVRAGVTQNSLLAAVSPQVAGWETFRIIFLSTDEIALQSDLSGQYVRAGVGQDSLLAAVSPHILGWETFRIINLTP